MTKKDFIYFLVPGFLATILMYLTSDTIDGRMGGGVLGHIFLVSVCSVGLSIILWPVLIGLWKGSAFLKRAVDKTVVAFRTEDYMSLRAAVMAKGLGEDFVSRDRGENTSYAWAAMAWRRHYRSLKIWRGVTIASFFLPWAGLVLFLGTYNKDGLSAERMANQHTGAWVVVVISALVSLYFGLRSSRANPASGLGIALSMLDLGIQEPSTAWERADPKELTVAKGNTSFGITLSGSPGRVDLVVKGKMLPSHISLEAIRHDTLDLEKRDINLGDPQWDKASLLTVKTKDNHDEFPGLWFPPEVRTLLLPLLALGCKVHQGQLAIRGLPLSGDLGEQIIEAIDWVTALVPRWQAIQNMTAAERPFNALRDEENSVVRGVLVNALQGCLSQPDSQALNLRWALEGEGPTRLLAAGHLSSLSEKTQALTAIVAHSPMLPVRAEALGMLWSLNHIEGEKLVLELAEKDQADVVYECSLKHRPRVSHAAESPWREFPSRTNALATRYPHLAPSLALISLHAGVSSELTATWFTWALKAPVPEHRDIVRAGLKLLENKAAVWLGPSDRSSTWRDECLAALRELEPELDARLERAAKALVGNLSIASGGEEGQLTIAEDGNLSFATESEGVGPDSS